MKKILFITTIILSIVLLNLYLLNYKVKICNKTNKNLNVNLFYNNESLTDKIKSKLLKNYIYSKGGILSFGEIKRNSCSEIYSIDFLDNHIILKGYLQDNTSRKSIVCDSYFIDNFGKKNFSYGKYNINLYSLDFKKDICTLKYNIKKE